MAPTVADSGFVIAMLNRSDPDHGRVSEVARTLGTPPWLPSPAITEICYVLASRLGTVAVTTLLRRLAEPAPGLAAIDPEPGDYLRAAEIVSQYGDSGLDFVDAIVVAIAERLDVRTLLTLDRTHLGLVRPVHCYRFDLLPE